VVPDLDLAAAAAGFLQVAPLMPTIIAEHEAHPTSWPAIPVDGLDLASRAAVWRRIESFIALRVAPREAIYTVAGPGAWRPRLRPFEIDLVEQWGADGWETVTGLAPEPLGGVELGCGTYRITASIGSFGAPPADVLEAARRLASYQLGMAGIGADVGRKELNIGELRVSSERWPARALQLSGAADLLRPYRDLGAAAWA
jgi:hypothetical protein